MKTLSTLGWTSFFENNSTYQMSLDSTEKLTPARVVGAFKNSYLIRMNNKEEWFAEVTGNLLHNAHIKSDLPVVGDWVLVSPRPNEKKATIKELLPRRTKISRKTNSKGKEGNFSGEEQIVASNVDVVFLATSLNQDLNLRRLERYLVMVAESEAQPVILLTKADLCPDLEGAIEKVRSITMRTPIHTISVHQNEGLEEIRSYFTEGTTSVVIGSSGVGKSTLVNWLVGKEVLTVQDIREDDAKGRHTTTNRHLFSLPEMGMVIDTPGMRELQIWDSSEGFSNTFEDLDELEKRCRFNNCQHDTEPGCAIQAALEDGSLDQSRYNSYLKLGRETKFEERRVSREGQQQFRKEMREFNLDNRRRENFKKKYKEFAR